MYIVAEIHKDIVRTATGHELKQIVVANLLAGDYMHIDTFVGDDIPPIIEAIIEWLYQTQQAEAGAETITFAFADKPHSAWIEPQATKMEIENQIKQLWTEGI